MDDRTMAGFEAKQQLRLDKVRYYCDVAEDPSQQPKHHAKFMERYIRLKQRFAEAIRAAAEMKPPPIQPLSLS